MPELPDWVRGLALLGKHGADYVTIQTDADGNLFAVLKGDDGGVLRTIALDDEGRMSAFIYDTVDAWGQISTVGFAELAVRLGSPVIYERSGQTFLLETFKYGKQRWSAYTEGTGASIDLAADVCLSDGYSVKLIGGSDSGQKALLGYRGGVLPIGRIGFGFTFSYDSDFLGTYFMGRYQGDGGVWQPRVKLRPEYDAIDLYTAGESYVQVGTLASLIKAKTSFCNLKFVCDLATKNYVKLRLNAQEIDISGYQIHQYGENYAPELQVKVEHRSRTSYNDIMYLDAVQVTFAEP